MQGVAQRGKKYVKRCNGLFEGSSRRDAFGVA